jgi:preprotein translocase subunit SecE
VARNRKRAKARARRPPGDAGRRSIATAGVDAPNPIEHASPDVELAEAELARGRGDLEPVEDAEPGAEEELASPEFGESPNVPGVFPERVRPEPVEDEVDEAELDEADLDEAELGDEAEVETLPAARRAAAPAEHRVRTGKRLINFLQGSWRELQRVQWPDRRQVMQATGVVIGFVIVAGVFLGVADFLSTKIMNYILTGHFK